MSAKPLENSELAMTTTGASRAESPAFTQELLWRHPPATLLPADSAERLLVTRWRNSQETAHRERAPATDCCVVALSMQAVSVRIMRDGATVYDGALPPGAMFLAAPGEELTADFDGPCDFLHIYLPPTAWRQRAAEFWGADAPDRTGDVILVRDSLAEQLARSLLKACDAGQRAYSEAVAGAVVARYLLLTRVKRVSTQALQRWRLRRVQTHIEENLAEPLRLAELAGVAGLSRMHFAAQFRAATGYRPHEYLLWRRVEKAKAMLRKAELPVVQVALEVGFQAQAHFTTVFKRLTGDTPASWRTLQRTEVVG